MPPLLSCFDLTKQYGVKPLFTSISLAVNEGERHGLIGPNGAGKSTLLKILADLEHGDSGEVALRKGARLFYVEQDPEFDPSLTVQEVASSVAHEEAVIPALLGQAGFDDPSVVSGTLSGGWRKRLALVRALAARPDLLLLDEPTNHLDLQGIQWLERTLASVPFASVTISHDRYFLENVATRMMELSRVYPEGLFKVDGNYSDFLEKREAWQEAQTKMMEGLAARVRREVAWLRRGAKARTRKSKARLDSAAAMIRQLDEMEQRAVVSTAAIDFSASDRKTKRLVELDNAACELGGRQLFSGVNLVLAPGRRLGLAGSNGSGKTTFLQLLRGSIEPSEGSIKRADHLKIVYFDQNRESFDPSTTLQRALAPEGDSVLYQGRPIHVNAWARRFLFREEQLVQPVGSLSGGERARIHIARLMLEEADLLLLDEPTNDLDLATLEVLEERLLEFPGALVLVTHDRYLLEKVTSAVLGLDGFGGAGLFADLNQWEDWLDQRRAEKARSEQPAVKPLAGAAKPVLQKKRLSYIEQREFEGMESRILVAELRVSECEAALHASGAAADPARLETAYRDLQQAQAEVESLYARWAELDAKF
ncbi:MAG: ABC-F family ATP-binding cassette domain-containing protein [Bryobacteraceae bacterium]|nr:ABC-F family ATP-binding cassette domain-containing protein [Bryobacteraceae bacterium]